MNVHVYMCPCLSICLVSIYTYICVSTYTCVCIYLYIYVYLRIRVCVRNVFNFNQRVLKNRAIPSYDPSLPDSLVDSCLNGSSDNLDGPCVPWSQ